MAEQHDQTPPAPPVDHDGNDTALATTNSDVAVPPEKKIKKMVRKKRRPTRVQVDGNSATSEPPPQTGTIYNIWYNKWSGGDRESYQQTHARGRCNIARDSGYTRADGEPGSYFCLRFERGLCPKDVR